ncbi:MAG TPA: hypothetical protein VMK12_29075 [Anaeromyxobacteraceae bacterium]|nr:hypothetical protein [Anaeromyxobacteraceae bacterium]
MSAGAEVTPPPATRRPFDWDSSPGQVIRELEALRKEAEREFLSNPPEARSEELSRRMYAIDRSLDLWLRWRR